jgi:nucleoid DNA-binding protein
LSKINKAALAKKINKRLTGVISTAVIQDAIGTVCHVLVDKIVAEESISIDNFGTICYSVSDGHKGYNVSTGEIKFVEPFKQIVFIPHHVFSELINQKIDNFR